MSRSSPAQLTSRPKDANLWTNGKALIATGSPFDPVDIPSKSKKYVIAECNNVSRGSMTHNKAETYQALIYPGLGLGTILSQSKLMTDKMIIAGAKKLSELAPAMRDPDDALLPPFGGE